jgi:hypothetical protein
MKNLVFLTFLSFAFISNAKIEQGNIAIDLNNLAFSNSTNSPFQEEIKKKKKKRKKAKKVQNTETKMLQEKISISEENQAVSKKKKKKK